MVLDIDLPMFLVAVQCNFIAYDILNYLIGIGTFAYGFLATRNDGRLGYNDVV